MWSAAGNILIWSSYGEILILVIKLQICKNVLLEENLYHY